MAWFGFRIVEREVNTTRGTRELRVNACQVGSCTKALPGLPGTLGMAGGGGVCIAWDTCECCDALDVLQYCVSNLSVGLSLNGASKAVHERG